MRHGTTKVLIAERDGEWEGWADQLRTTESTVRVVAQRPGETATAFAARVRTEMGRVEGAVAEAVLIGGVACDPEVLGARVLMVRAVTSRMPSAGRLHLDGRGRAKLAMAALAEICSDQLAASGVAVFTEPMLPAATEATPSTAPAAMPLAA
jgi:hypothetical protein